MPRTFNEMVKKGAKIRTKQLSHGRFVRIATLGGKSAMGHVQTKKSWVGKLKEKVQKHLKKSKKSTVRTKDVQSQLKKAGVTFKTDKQKAEERKRKNK